MVGQSEPAERVDGEPVPPSIEMTLVARSLERRKIEPTPANIVPIIGSCSGAPGCTVILSVSLRLSKSSSATRPPPPGPPLTVPAAAAPPLAETEPEPPIEAP